MSTKQRGLGRGLDALLGAQASTGTEQKMLPLNQIVPSKYQPRGIMEQEALAELTQSIKTHGVMQPVLVRETTSGQYEIIAGERRFQASKRAGLTDIPVLVKRVDDQTSAVMALIENMQREDLNPLEEAKGIARLIQEFSLTHEQVAEILGKSRATITNTLRLTSLASAVQEWLIKGAIEMGHARCLLTLSSTDQVQLAQKIILNQWPVRKTEFAVKALKAEANDAVKNRGSANAGVKTNSESEPARQLTRLAEQLSDQFAVSITLQSRKDRFIFTADFSDQAALEQFIQRVQGEGLRA